MEDISNQTADANSDQVAEVNLYGGGGAGYCYSGCSTNAAAGGTSTLISSGSSLTAAGGQAGKQGAATSNACTVGGNLRGAPGGPGGVYSVFDDELTGSSGCPGRLVLQLLTVTPGESLTYTIGAGGAGGDDGAGDGAKGGNGYLVLEWEE